MLTTIKLLKNLILSLLLSFYQFQADTNSAIY